MVKLCAQGDALLTSFCLTFISMTAAQYENYNFRNFPKEELMPLTTAYGLALDHYAAESWTESIKYLELSLRLHRLLKDSVRHCVLHCDNSKHEEEPSFEGNPDLRVYWHVMMRASCQRKCRAHFPALQLPPPGREILEDFRRRSPYRYLHFAHSRLNDLQGAVPCAYTYLQKNPEDQEMQQLMKDYKSQYDLSGYLTDHEEQPYEITAFQLCVHRELNKFSQHRKLDNKSLTDASFLRGVKLINSGDYDGGVEHMEESLRLYLHEYDLCQADCEGIGQLLPDSDFYAVIAGAFRFIQLSGLILETTGLSDLAVAQTRSTFTCYNNVYADILRCKLKCEENLMPNVGGYFVEKFVATVYHYLQYAYYKLNEGRRAVRCAYSYFLFEHEDKVMEQNLQYYKAYGEQWGLQSDHYTPRMEALKHHNQTVTQKQMLMFLEKYLELNDEDFLGPEEAALSASESPDVEFEGMGDYEESFYADWRQPKGKGDAGESES